MYCKVHLWSECIAGQSNRSQHLVCVTQPDPQDSNTKGRYYSTIPLLCVTRNLYIVVPRVTSHWFIENTEGGYYSAIMCHQELVLYPVLQVTRHRLQKPKEDTDNYCVSPGTSTLPYPVLQVTGYLQTPKEDTFPLLCVTRKLGTASNTKGGF